jgi:hypothetical protein
MCSFGKLGGGDGSDGRGSGGGVDINRTCERIRESMKVSATENVGYLK